MTKTKGHLYVIAAPSGTGKTTLVKALVEALPEIHVSISHTTRPKRPTEAHGINYYFVDENIFATMIAHNEFLEHATIFDYHYGTSRQFVEEALSRGQDVILEIDWQGQEQIKKLFPDAISIFILPPSVEELRQRLIKRNQDQPDIIKKRLADTKEAVSHAKNFDYILVNDEFTKALEELKVIIQSSQYLEKRQSIQLATLITQLEKMN